jgi:hypothetical protein
MLDQTPTQPVGIWVGGHSPAGIAPRVRRAGIGVGAGKQAVRATTSATTTSKAMTSEMYFFIFFSCEKNFGDNNYVPNSIESVNPIEFGTSAENAPIYQ